MLSITTINISDISPTFIFTLCSLKQEIYGRKSAAWHPLTLFKALENIPWYFDSKSQV